MFTDVHIISSFVSFTHRYLSFVCNRMDVNSDAVDTSPSNCLVMQDLSCDMNARIPLKTLDSSTNSDEPEDVTVMVVDANHLFKPEKEVDNVNFKTNALPTEELGTRINGKTNGRCHKKRLAVETKDVCFKYRSSPNLILSDVSMRIPEGTM